MPKIKVNFWNENGRTLKKPDLICLRQNHELYKTLLLQLVGKIEFDKDGIRIKDKNLAAAKFNQFIDVAIKENIDLAITPEYSCPWSCIEAFIAENKLPDEGKIWILGSQSIRPNEFTELIGRNQQVVWIYDEVLLAQKNIDYKFFDPVCLLLKTRDERCDIKNVIIVQFKTHDSAEIWERDNLLLGNTLYLIENKFSSTKLLTYICSDTLQSIDLNMENDGYLLNAPLLLIHIQLNQKPFDALYKRYRNNIYFYGNANDYSKEIICLNWARKVTYDDEEAQEKEFNKYGGSSFYCKTSQINVEDNRINENHQKGLYYTSWKDKRTHVSFLNYNEHVFLVENTKPSQASSLAVNSKRTGPKVLHIYQWANTKWEELQGADDGFAQVCSDIDDGTGNLSCLTGNQNITDVERIIQLSSGEIDEKAKENWGNIINLYSFQIGDSEFNSRNTFTHDPDNDSKDKRRGRIRKYHMLKNTILTLPEQVPAAFADAMLKYDKTLTSKNIYLLNLHSENTGRNGTAIYLGDRTPSEAKAFKVKIESLFNEDQQGKQVIVWYSTPDLKRIYDESRKPEINENVSKSSVSYKKDKA
jgi:hypothetical protein